MIRLTATAIGPIAAELLDAHHEIEVLAVFERSFYVMTHGGLVCRGAEGIGLGPINVPLEEADAIDWRQIGVDTETEGELTHGTLTFGDTVSISTSHAKVWQPPPWKPLSEATNRGLDVLHAIAQPRLPSEGLSALVLARAPGNLSSVAKAAAPQLDHLRASLPGLLVSQQATKDTTRALTLLLGLGPGLTPSGDDVIGGMMLALTALGGTRLRDALWEALTPELGDLTTEISAMHLSAAADGLGADAVHRLGNVILAGEAHAIPGLLEHVSRIGHCSGWDTIAGFVLTIEAALRNRNAKAARKE